MRGDGDGWVTGSDGSKHWGKHGAAGLLLRAPSEDPAGEPLVLLQHRALWSHRGGTWALPGGAKDSHESAVEAAVREADEETGIASGLINVRSERVTAQADSGWSYTTVMADADHPLATTPNGESTELRWVPESKVDQLPLHPAFAESWPVLRTTPLRVLLDTANVLGSRPDGWWKDRAGATSLLLNSLAKELPRTVELPSGIFGWLPLVEAVLEGKAKDAEWEGDRISVVHAPGSGDDELYRRAAVEDGTLTALVTADRGLQGRVPDSVVTISPSLVLSWISDATHS